MERTPQEQRMFGPDWVRVWSQTWGATGQWTGQLSLITARDNAGVLQGILPLGYPRLGPLMIHATGGHDVPFRGITSAEWMEAEVGAAIGDFIADQQWPLVQLGPLRQSSLSSHAMLSQLSQRGTLIHPRAFYEDITLRTPDTWDEYVHTVLSRKLIRKVRRTQRNMHHDGHMRIRHFRQPSAQQTELLYHDLAQIESASWMATRASAVPRFSNPELCRFWKQLTLQHLSPGDYLDCWVMYFNSRPVSFCYTLTNESVRYVIANNYDTCVSEYGTGAAIYWEMIREGMGRGVRVFEFGDGHMHYKSRWGAKLDGCRMTYAVVPNRFLGKVARLTMHAKDLVYS